MGNIDQLNSDSTDCVVILILFMVLGKQDYLILIITVAHVI